MAATEQDILKTRMAAARMEWHAAALRLKTAKREEESAEKTIQMAELVAQSMMAREGYAQNQGSEDG